MLLTIVRMLHGSLPYFCLLFQTDILKLITHKNVCNKTTITNKSLELFNNFAVFKIQFFKYINTNNFIKSKISFKNMVYIYTMKKKNYRKYCHCGFCELCNYKI